MTKEGEFLLFCSPSFSSTPRGRVVVFEHRSIGYGGSSSLSSSSVYARVRKCCLVYFWQFETFSKNFWNWDWGNFALQSKKLLSLFSLFARGQIRLTTLNTKSLLHA